jgi:hypothetical protein
MLANRRPVSVAADGNPAMVAGPQKDHYGDLKAHFFAQAIAPGKDL